MKVEQVKLSELKLYPNNPRKGNLKVIAESLTAHGQYKPITVNQRTNEILAGNHTYRAAQSLGWTTIATVFVDVDEVTASKIVAIDNRSTDVSDYDNEVLAALLGELPSLEATGYDESDLDDLKALLEERTAPITGRLSHTEVGDTGQNGTYTQPSLAEYKDRYAEKATRMLIADYPNNTFIWLTDKLVEYRERYNLKSNADAIVFIFEKDSGEKAPL